MSSSFNQTTVDPEECEYFKTLCSTWWSNPELQALQNSCELIVPYICTNVQETYPNKPLGSLRILEVGCGGGFLSERLSRAGCNLVAIDINQELLQIAKMHLQCDPNLPKITYLLEAVEDHCKKNYQQYDVVISNFVLEHVSDHDYFIKCCSDCVKPGGLLFMSAISKTFLSWLFLILIAENIVGLIPVGMHHYDKCITASDTESIMKSYNMKIKNTRGMFYNMITKAAIFFPTNTFSFIVCAIRSTE